MDLPPGKPPGGKLEGSGFLSKISDLQAQKIALKKSKKVLDKTSFYVYNEPRR